MSAVSANGAGEVSPKIEAMRAYAEAGYTLIPLKGKIPVVSNWVDITPGAYGEHNIGPRNYGVSLKAGDLVIDIDPRNFDKGDHPIKRLVADIGSKLDSYTVTTGGGGLHIYFSKPPDLMVTGGLAAYPGIEFKSAGRQVVGPGSIHPDTKKVYTVTLGSPRKIAPAPKKLLDLIKRVAVPFSELAGGTGKYISDAATQGRFAKYLQEVAPVSVEGKRGDDTAFKVSCYGRDLALPPAMAWELMVEYWNPKCQPPWDPEELKAKVIHAYRYAKGNVGGKHPAAEFKALPEKDKVKPIESEEISWVMTNNGVIVYNFQNLLSYLRWPEGGLHKLFGYNMFTGRVEFLNPAPWHRGLLPTSSSVTDNDLKMLKGHLASKHGFEMPVSNIEEAVTITAQRNPFHPVKEYLNSLEWDGTHRVDYWLRDFLGVEDMKYTRACARKVLCAAVMRIMKPAVKFDHVLVLEGAQGIGKSGVCRILAGQWGADFPVDPRNKDTVDLMQGKWILELPELEVFSRTDIENLKAFVSRETDRVRLAYGRRSSEFPRQSIFIASKNPEADGTYLMDSSGNRRWWPVSCNPPGGRVDFRRFKEVRNQLFAEAMHLVKDKGEALYMDTRELQTAANDVVSMRHAEHPWTDRVAQWLDGVLHTPGAERDFITSMEVYVDALAGVPRTFDRRDAQAIARILRAEGWKHGIKRVGGRVVRGYHAPGRVGKGDILGNMV